jgi:hypothetical protein
MAAGNGREMATSEKKTEQRTPSGKVECENQLIHKAAAACDLATR